MDGSSHKAAARGTFCLNILCKIPKEIGIMYDFELEKIAF